MNGGTTGSTGPFILAITDPKLGFPSRWLWPMGKPVTFWKLECSSRRPTIDRMTATLSMTPAIRGSISLIWTPGSRVAIGLNSPRMPSGASVLMSKVS